MIYVFDTSSLRSLQHFYPTVFVTIWNGLNSLVRQNSLISTREVWTELERQNVSADVLAWAKQNKQIFTLPDRDEQRFVAKIFQVPHFQSLIGERQRLTGMPVADPFVIACAKIKNGTVVTEERKKPNAAKIPNVCEHFKVRYIDLEGFMKEQGWTF
ncbi:MAG: PIN domain-containing protein [Leptospirales bacterium]